MRYFAYLFISLFTIFVSQTATAESPETRMLAATSSWVNQSGSVASLSFALSSQQPSTYVVTGNYINNAPGFQCQGTPYPLSGVYYVNTQTISFSVAWSNSSEDCQSVTGWTGYFDLNQSPLIMITDWNLAYSGTNGTQITQGSDTFSQKQVTLSERLISD